MYTITKSYHDNQDDSNYVRIWLFVESMFFFSWIVSGIIFLIMAHLSKFRSTIKSDLILQMDNDPWNDRKTDDFFRYIKFDYFVFTLYLTCLLVDSIFY